MCKIPLLEQLECEGTSFLQGTSFKEESHLVNDPFLINSTTATIKGRSFSSTTHILVSQGWIFKKNIWTHYTNSEFNQDGADGADYISADFSWVSSHSDHHRLLQLETARAKKKCCKPHMRRQHWPEGGGGGQQRLLLHRLRSRTWNKQDRLQSVLWMKKKIHAIWNRNIILARKSVVYMK